MSEIPKKYTIDNAKNDIQNLQDQNKYDFQEIKRLDGLIKEYDEIISQSINFNRQINKKFQSQITSLLDKIKNLEDSSPSGGGSGLTITQSNQLNTAYNHSQSPHVKASDIPIKTSQLTNDSDFASKTYVTNAINNAQLGGSNTDIDLSIYQLAQDNNLTTTNKTVTGAINELKSGLNGITVPTKTSELINNSGFITTIPSEYVTETEMNEAIANISSGGSGGGSTPVALTEPYDDDIPRIFFSEGILPTTKTSTTMKFEYISKNKRYSGYVDIKCQGTSSMSYPKKNFTIKTYNDKALADKMKINFMNWGNQNKFCLKANYIDLSHARNLVSARLWSDIVKTRENYLELPELLRTSPNNGAVNGFFVKLYANGVYQGRYTMNIPKDGWMANMDKSIDEHCILCGENYQSGLFRATAKIDGSDWSDELHKTVPTSIVNRWNQVINFVMNSSDSDFKTNIGQYFDITSLIDYYIFAYVSCGLDSMGKNQIYMTYDGQKWFASMYDMDSTWGLYWNGKQFVSASYRMQDDYESAVEGRAKNLLYLKLEKTFINEIKERYVVLRNGALSETNIINRFEEFMICNNDLIKEDCEIFTGIPSQNTNNIKQIRKYVVDRCKYVDGQIDKLTTPDTPDTNVRVTGVTLNNDTLTIDKIGGTYTLSYTITPYNATNKNVTWSTSESTIASINNGIITANANGSTVITIKTTDGGYTDSCTVTVNDVSHEEDGGDENLYVPDIASYGIYNDGSNSESTTNGLNTLFADLNTNKKRNVQLPTGTYAINPDISLTPKSNLSLDLNNSTLKIDTNGKNGSTMVYLKEVENFTLKNGTIEGDRYDHDYSTFNQNTTSHEFNVGLKIDQGSRNINIDNVKFNKITGYGLATFQGTQYCNTRLDKTIMESGSYDDSGNKVSNSQTIRYPNKVNITEHATYGYLQVGTLLNYQNYVFNSTRVVTVLIFDNNDTLLSKTTSNMYRPISVPPNANYCYLVFNQSDPTDYLDGDIYTLDVFHMKPPRDCNITNCTFDDNRCLGIAICGGWNFKIEGNTFKNTSKPTSDKTSPNYQHGKPGYAIDIEDGWESTQDLTIHNNVFTNNGQGDIVSLAGDNTVITNNQFTGRVAMYSRNTNYVVQNNTISNAIAMWETEKDYGFTVDHNTYTDTTIKAKCYKPYDVDYYSFNNETITNCEMQLDTSITLKNSTIDLDGTTNSRFTGSYDTCTITDFDGNDANSDYNTGIKLNNCNVSKCNFFPSKDTIMTNNVFNTFRVRLDNGTLVFTGNDIQSNPKNAAMPIVQLNGGTKATIKNNTLSSNVTVELYTNPGNIEVIEEGAAVTDGLVRYIDFALDEETKATKPTTLKDKVDDSITYNISGSNVLYMQNNITNDGVGWKETGIRSKQYTGGSIGIETFQYQMPEQFTIECCQSFNNVSTLLRILSIRNSFHDMIFQVNVSGGKIQIQNGAKTVNNSYTFETDKLYHVAITYDGANVRLLINGDEVIESQAYTKVGDSTTFYVKPFGISDGLKFEGSVEGLLCYFKIYNRVLNDNEIASNYAIESANRVMDR